MADKNKDKQQDPEEVNPPVEAVAAQRVIDFLNTQADSTFSPIEDDPSGVQLADVPPEFLGGPPTGPGLVEGELMYDPTAGNYKSRLAMQDLEKKKKQ